MLQKAQGNNAEGGERRETVIAHLTAKTQRSSR